MFTLSPPDFSFRREMKPLSCVTTSLEKQPAALALVNRESVQVRTGEPASLAAGFHRRYFKRTMSRRSAQ